MNNNFVRNNNQGNRQRGRGNRNRHRSTGGGGSGGGGGNSSNKVFDSNGPDVKLRGTAQTVAEKYMQLGRDAQSSGDTVAAESYYQHAEHYYRIWAANQPQGASLQMTRKFGEEEFEEDNAEEGEGDEAAEGQNGEAVMQAEGGEPQAEQQNAEGGEGREQRQNNNNRNNNGEQRGNRNERFRPKWQNRRERFNQEGGAEQNGQAAGEQPPQVQADAGEASGQWEAPSFLQRPTPAPAPAVAEAEAAAEPSPRRVRPRRERTEDAASAPVSDEPVPQAD